MLYRRNQDNIFPEIDGDVATTDVIVNSFINIGIGQLSNGKPCFINFTERLLNIRLPSYFQPNEIVVEILETVEFNHGLVEICKELKNQGYKIALDDFVLNKENPYSYPLLKLADIVKVDFRETTAKTRQVIEYFSKRFHFKLLAEKIETKEEYDSAVKSGYEYFQGYFFSKPIILSTKDVPEYFQNYFVIINHLSKDEPDLDKITELIEQDLSLSYKLLKLINSPAYRPASKINSIRQAIVRLGLAELKKWLYILSIRGSVTVRSEWSNEIFFNSLVRAKMCELIAMHVNKQTEASSYFLTGMLSLMDTLLGQNMEEILHSMPLQENICEALKGHRNQMKDALDLIISIEKGDWEEFSILCTKVHLEDSIAHSCYYEAFEWAKQLIEEP
nr:HDOD domain-containing protein [Bacillus sp. FJAT-49711]